MSEILILPVIENKNKVIIFNRIVNQNMFPLKKSDFKIIIQIQIFEFLKSFQFLMCWKYACAVQYSNIDWMDLSEKRRLAFINALQIKFWNGFTN
jgi:hypothetical protein